MTIDQVFIIINGQRYKLADEIVNAIWENDHALEKLFSLMVAFLDQVQNKKILDLDNLEDFHTFENIVNLAGVIPYTTRNSTQYSLREINPSLSEKFFTLMLKVMRSHPRYIHKGTPLHNLGSSQFSNQNIDSALININEALRTDFYATGGDARKVKERPGFLVLTEDLKRIYSPEITNLISYYNAYFRKNIQTDTFLIKITKLAKKKFLLNFFLYQLIHQYSLVFKFEQENFPSNNFNIPANEYLLMVRYNCLRNCTILCEELLRTILGRPRMSVASLKLLLKQYLTKRSGKFKKINKLIDIYWDNNKNNVKDTSLVTFRLPGYKTRQIDGKVRRILKGNKKLNNSNSGLLAKSLFMTGLIRNYTNHHIDIGTKFLKEKALFDDVFKLCFNSILFIVTEENL